LAGIALDADTITVTNGAIPQQGTTGPPQRLIVNGSPTRPSDVETERTSIGSQRVRFDDAP
jgi:hypothetical protein